MGICICCCCNKKNTECLENTLIVFTSIEIFFLLLGLILIDWKIAEALSLIINILILLLLVACLTFLILFKIFREYETIYSKYRKICYVLGYLGMSFSILCFIFSIISESLISEKIYKYDHPCLYRISEFSNNETNSNNDNSGDTSLVLDITYNETTIKKICEKINKIDDIFWYNKRSEPKDIYMSYICSTIIEIFSLIGSFFWYNDTRRIKYCIKNKMNDGKGVIIYGPLGGYLGKHVVKTGTKIEKVEFINSKENMNLNMNMSTKRNRINSSSNSYDKSKKNEITSVQNEINEDDIINEIDVNNEKDDNNKKIEESLSQNKEDKKVEEKSGYSDDFY